MQTLLTISTSAPSAQNTKPPHLPSQCFLETYLMPLAGHCSRLYDPNGQEYLMICNAFSKYPFPCKTTTKSTQSLCACLLELISQYGPPSMLYTDNGLPFASEELAENLMYQCTEHSTSSPPLPRSNGFIECQIRTIKTALNTALPAKIP